MAPPALPSESRQGKRMKVEDPFAAETEGTANPVDKFYTTGTGLGTTIIILI